MNRFFLMVGEAGRGWNPLLLLQPGLLETLRLTCLSQTEASPQPHEQASRREEVGRAGLGKEAHVGARSLSLPLLCFLIHL